MQWHILWAQIVCCLRAFCLCLCLLCYTSRLTRSSLRHEMCNNWNFAGSFMFRLFLFEKFVVDVIKWSGLNSESLGVLGFSTMQPCGVNCETLPITRLTVFMSLPLQNTEDHLAFLITVPAALFLFLSIFILVCIESVFKRMLRLFSLLIWACLVTMGYLFMFSGGILSPWDQVNASVYVVCVLLGGTGIIYCIQYVCNHFDRLIAYIQPPLSSCCYGRHNVFSIPLYVISRITRIPNQAKWVLVLDKGLREVDLWRRQHGNKEPVVQ